MKFTRYQKRDAIRDYFPLPNEIFSLGLSTSEIAVYAYLMYCEDSRTHNTTYMAEYPAKFAVNFATPKSARFLSPQPLN